MNRLKELRKEKKLSQKEIANFLNINEKTISRWESGENTIKSDKAQKLADYFGVSVAYLLGYEDTKKTYQDEFLFSDGSGGVVSFSESRNGEILEKYFQSREEEFIAFLEKHGMVISDKEIAGSLNFLATMNINTNRNKAFNEVLSQKDPKEFLEKMGYTKLSKAFNSQPVEEFKKSNGYDTEHIL